MMKLILMLILLVACLPLISCATGSNTLGEANRSIGETTADTLPTWMGGLPAGVPPRRGTPEYDAWQAERAREAARPKNDQAK
jgi:hypothetical protein